MAKKKTSNAPERLTDSDIAFRYASKDDIEKLLEMPSLTEYIANSLMDLTLFSQDVKYHNALAYLQHLNNLEIKTSTAYLNACKEDISLLFNDANSLSENITAKDISDLYAENDLELAKLRELLARLKETEPERLKTVLTPFENEKANIIERYNNVIQNPQPEDWQDRFDSLEDYLASKKKDKDNDLFFVDLEIKRLTNEEKEPIKEFNIRIGLRKDLQKRNYNTALDLFCRSCPTLLECAEALGKTEQTKNLISKNIERAIAEYLSNYSKEKQIKKASTFDKLASVSAKNYTHAFQPLINDYAFVFKTTEDFFEKMSLEETRPNFCGELKTQEKKIREGQKIKDRILAPDYLKEDYSLFPALFQNYVQYQRDNDILDDELIIDMPTFCKSIGKQIRGKFVDENGNYTGAGTIQDIVDVINGYCINHKAYIDETIITPFSFTGFYTKDHSIIILSCPYFKKLYKKALIESERTQKQKGTNKVKLYTIPNENFLIDSSVTLREKNRIPYEIVCYITSGFLQLCGTKNGKQKDGKYHYHVSYQTIIDNCPQLKQKLLESSVNAQNTYLQRHFEGAFKMLRNHTEVYSFFSDLHMDETFKLSTTVLSKNYFTATFSGKNNDFKPVYGEQLTLEQQQPYRKQ